MADATQRYKDNAAGRWYVDTSCIICGLCSEYAPDTFKISEEGDHNFVFRQPSSDDQLREAEEAKEKCPVDAIGNDG